MACDDDTSGPHAAGAPGTAAGLAATRGMVIVGVAGAATNSADSCFLSRCFFP